MAAGPLDGLRVLDCSGMLSGGFATMTLADFGADVVTVEHPEHHDPIRDWPPFENDTSLWWKSLARNKRCVTLDLSTDEGRALALELAADADLLFENFRPGTMGRWGLDYRTLRETNEELILVRISGYGQTGPRAEQPGFGTAAQASRGSPTATATPTAIRSWHRSASPTSPPRRPRSSRRCSRSTSATSPAAARAR
jgi:formyl-CoA transferase